MKNLKKMVINIIAILLIAIYAIKGLAYKIMGYKRIDNIKIPKTLTRPREQQLNYWREFYRYFKFLPDVLINQHNYLIKGWDIYIVACELNLDYIKVKKIKRKLKINNNKEKREVICQ